MNINYSDFIENEKNIDNIINLDLNDKSGIEDNNINIINDNKKEEDMDNIQKNIIEANDKYIKKIEQNEKIHFEQMKSCLLKIDPNDFKNDE